MKGQRILFICLIVNAHITFMSILWHTLLYSIQEKIESAFCRLKWSHECTICILFFVIFSGEESPWPPLAKANSIMQPYCVSGAWKFAFIARRLVYNPISPGSELSFWIHQWRCAILILYNFTKHTGLVLVSLIGLLCTLDCTKMLHFIKIFPEPPPTGVRPLPNSSSRRPFGPRRTPPPPVWLLDPPLLPLFSGWLSSTINRQIDFCTGSGFTRTSD